MEQSFQDLGKSLSRTSTELLNRMAEIQKLRLAVKRAEATVSRRPSSDRLEIERATNRAQVGPVLAPAGK